MVNGPLVDRYVNAGARFVEALDRDGVAIRCAAWFLSPDTERWTLLLGIDDRRKNGTRWALELIQPTFRANRDILAPLDFEDITVKDPAEPPLSLVRRVVNTKSNAIEQIPFSGNAIDGVLIKDMLIYRMS